tara:strand:+ start:68 stop:670 length:603 start_codon:yes stop_codon:yes gene_type:complete
MESNLFNNFFNIINSSQVNETIQQSLNSNANPYKKVTCPDFLSTLNIYKIKEEDIKLDNYCSICVSKFDLDQEVIELPCGHLYHSNSNDDCGGLVKWLEENNTCPVCRHELPFIEKKIEEESNEIIEETNISIPIQSNLLLLNIMSNLNREGIYYINRRLDVEQHDVESENEYFQSMILLIDDGYNQSDVDLAVQRSLEP